jgi:hypothetical protein
MGLMLSLMADNKVQGKAKPLQAYDRVYGLEITGSSKVYFKFGLFFHQMVRK